MVYPFGRWVPYTSPLTCTERHKTPEKDGIPYIQKIFKLSKKRKYRSYRSVTSIADFIQELQFPCSKKVYPPPPQPKSRKQIEDGFQQHGFQQRMSIIANEIRCYREKQHEMTDCTQNPQNTLFVAHMSRETTEETLENEFRCFGDIVNVKIVKNKEGQSRGYAFVEFTSENGVTNALHSSRKLIDGREVVLDIERGRIEAKWLPSRLRGDLVEKLQKASKHKRKQRRLKKKKKAEARRAALTNGQEGGANSENSQRQVSDIFQRVEAFSIVEPSSLGSTTAGKPRTNLSAAAEPFRSNRAANNVPVYLQPAAGNLQYNSVPWASSSGQQTRRFGEVGGENANFLTHPANNLNWFSQQYVSPLVSQPVVPQSFVATASNIQFQPPTHFAPQIYQISSHYVPGHSQQTASNFSTLQAALNPASSPAWVSEPFQQTCSHFAYISGPQANPNSAAVNYYTPPIAGTTQSTFNNQSHWASHQFDSPTQSRFESPINFQIQQPEFMLHPASLSISSPYVLLNVPSVPQGGQAPHFYTSGQQ